MSLAQGLRSLLVPSPDVLADTVKELYPLVNLSDKVLPLKSYFNMVQDIQRAKHTQAAMRAADEPLSREAIQQGVSRKLCTEDIFMVACSFLEVEIAKQGSVYYLSGESPDFKETKKNRNPLDLSDEVVLKNLSSGLARPDTDRGAVERGQIDSGFNHLVRLNQLHNLMVESVRLMKADERLTKVDIRKKFNISHTDYERMMSMARRSGLISFRNRKKDPSNSYTLRNDNHERVSEHAKNFGHTPQKMLNKILDDFFAMLEKRKKHED
ncbi:MULTISPECIES: hypothetical protein [Pseudomonas]|uniref:hypothetical protein n=1 Tax=Pseudomonas TaxID=286 RepID=UPI0002E2E7DE|nr:MULTISPECIES: hypothetical protein [Pseudomonas]